MRADRIWSRRQRAGVVVVESAVVYSVTLLLILGIIVGGLGVFRYQEVAHLAREGTRYASTHGGRYSEEGIPQQTGVSAVSSSSDLQTYLQSRAVLLDPSKLQVTVSWSAGNNVSPANYPYYVNTSSSLSPPAQQVITNNVTVTVSYQWFPECYLVGPFTLTSTSTLPMSY